METPKLLHADTSEYADRALPGLAGGAASSEPLSREADPRFKRGRLLVGVAALVAGALAKASERVALAADGDSLLLGRNNTATTQTNLTISSTFASGLRVINNGLGGTGVAGSSLSGGTGVAGSSIIGSGGTGVLGTGGFGGIGVRGSGAGGVVGSGVGVGSTGVFGNSRRGTGVFGFGGSSGVVGSGDTGVFGSGGTGVFGSSSSVVGGTGVRGRADRGPSAKGVAGVSQEGFAGYFEGKVYATRSVTTEDTLSVAAQHPDGTRRRLDSVASPLSYFQDFGKATLLRGRATVPLDPDFVALVRTDDYFVFLTPEARTRGLFVFKKSPTGFEVREGDDDQGGDRTDEKDRPGVAFVWQVVARRRDTAAAAARLESLAPPTPLPELPPMPEPPELPDLPDLTQAAP